MTWKEFKEKVEAAGVKDDMKINYIDIHTIIYDELTIFIDDEDEFTVYS